jgi:hypothetical protein
MAADYRMLTERLTRFYDFAGKTVLYVGAGGGRLMGPVASAKRLIAIDRDAAALASLDLEKVVADFANVEIKGDVVYFEFCLHEMADPLKALEHARTLAPDIVVFDHASGSEWAFLCSEENLVKRSAAAMSQFGCRRRDALHTEQRFRDHAELVDRIKGQGNVAIERARRLEGTSGIEIPMECELVLL